MDDPEVYMIGIRGCEPCEEMKTELASDRTKSALKTKFGKPDVKIIYPEDGDTNESGSLATDICYSLAIKTAPTLVVKRGEKVCTVNESLEETSCGVLKVAPER